MDTKTFDQIGGQKLLDVFFKSGETFRDHGGLANLGKGMLAMGTLIVVGPPCVLMDQVRNCYGKIMQNVK